MITFDEKAESNLELPEAEAFQLSSDIVFCTKGKRFLDLTIIGTSLLIIAPLCLFIAFLIFCDSPGDILFSQKRLGKDGKPFRLYKFRTMYETTCPLLGLAQATTHDLRITRIGHWLRRSSLDELPQLWNVVRGDMSLIGPRPHAIAHDRYFSQHIPMYWKRYAVKPGLTGWAQINGLRGETPEIKDMAARVGKDMEYIGQRTFKMDVLIALKTFQILFSPPACLH